MRFFLKKLKKKLINLKNRMVKLDFSKERQISVGIFPKNRKKKLMQLINRVFGN
jgi:hypoxanthine phosphoribosyltransferase